jgi:hypothetical protein
MELMDGPPKLRTTTMSDARGNLKRTRVPRIPWHDHEYGEALRQIAGIKVEPKPGPVKFGMDPVNDRFLNQVSDGEPELNEATEAAGRERRCIAHSVCSEEDCDRPAGAIGYCALHD